MKAAGGIGLAHCNYSKMPIQKGILFSGEGIRLETPLYVS
jgi:hypothetical protein